MNFAFSTAGSPAGAQFVTNAQMSNIKMQPVTSNGVSMPQILVSGMSMADGSMQYMRTLDGGATLQPAPQLITLPIALPGAKPGDPQQTVQIQVLNPNVLQAQQQPKYQMQIPIQGFQQGNAVLTVAYTPEGSNEGIQILPDGMQVLTIPQDMQLMQSSPSNSKEHVQQLIQQQIFTNPQGQQIILSQENKFNNNNNDEEMNIVIKEECEDNDDESSQGTEEMIESPSWNNSAPDIASYINKLPQQQSQTLPVSLQQFLILNSNEIKKDVDTKEFIEVEIEGNSDGEKEDDDAAKKRKKKYKKKSPKATKPKPGQVVISTGSDGSPLYCCPECQMAYADKERLELHLAVHKIERRFICGICGAGLKRKEHLERHKLGHNPDRPYVCPVCRKGFKRREHLNLHTVIHSGVKTELCMECGKGFYRKDHLRKHLRSHESRRARDDRMRDTNEANEKPAQCDTSTEITIHVPTGANNVQVPIQINIPQHVVTSLNAQQATLNSQTQLDALLAQHT